MAILFHQPLFCGNAHSDLSLPVSVPDGYLRCDPVTPIYHYSVSFSLRIQREFLQGKLSLWYSLHFDDVKLSCQLGITEKIHQGMQILLSLLIVSNLHPLALDAGKLERLTVEGK